MATNKIIALQIFVVLLACSFLMADGNFIGVCIRNCMQCKKIYGLYFDGQLCADNCLKFKGKNIPDCDNPETISMFFKYLAD